MECRHARRSFLDQASLLARTPRDKRALARADRALVVDCCGATIECIACKTAERESIAATIDQSGESYDWPPTASITDRESWPVSLPLDILLRLINIEHLDLELRQLQRDLQQWR